MDDVRLCVENGMSLIGDEVVAEQFDRLFNEAKSCFAESRFDNAIAACKSCLLLKPDHADALRLSAKAHLALNILGEAISDLAILCRILPDDATCHQELGKAYARAGDHAKSVSAFGRAVEIQPGRHDAWLGLGRAQAKLGKTENAIESLQIYVAAKPDNVVARADLVNALVSSRRYDEAVALGRDAIERGQTNPNLHRALAKALRAMKRTDEAIAHFAVFAEAKPEDASGRHDLGRALFYAGQYENAELELLEALRLTPTRYGVLIDLGRTLVAVGRYEEAEKHFAAFVRETGDIAGHLEIGRLLARTGRSRAAIRHLRSAVKQHPADIRLLREIAAVYRQAGQASAATAAYRAALAAAPKDIGLLHEFARFQLHARRHTTALKLLRQVFDADATRPNLRRQMAACLLAMGQLEEAETLLRTVLQLEPGDQDAHIDLIALLGHSGQRKALDEAFAAALNTVGESETLLREVAKAQMRLRCWQDAAAVLDRLRELQPDALFPLMQSVRVAMTMRKYDRAKQLCAELLQRFPDEIDAVYEWGRVCMETSASDRAKASFEAVLARQADHHQSHYRLAQLAMRRFDLEASIDHLNKAVVLAEQNTTYRLDRGRIWLSLNQLDRAEEDARAVLAKEPSNLRAVQILSAVAESREEAGDLKIGCIVYAKPDSIQELTAEFAARGDFFDVHFLSDRRASPGIHHPFGETAIETVLNMSPDANWIAIGDAQHARLLFERLGNEKQSNALSIVENMYAYVVLEGASSDPSLTIYRRDLLQLFSEVAALRGVSTADILAEHSPLLRGIRIAISGALERMPASRPPAESGNVFLVSRHGIELYGGGEHFLRGMGKLYRAKGFFPRIIGMRSDMMQLRVGEQDGFAFADLPVTPASILDLTLREQPTIVHILSGLGYEILTALKYLHVATIYGTHFWRDMFEEIGGYQNLEENAVPRREFNQIIRNATVIYSNSNYTDEIKRLNFGVSTPIIYSLNDEPDHESPQNGQYALLVNARPEKGFDLVLKVAALVPHVPFLVIASQSPVAQAEEEVEAANLSNVTVIGKTANLAEIYRQARVVLVPSYAFRETFSRVVIEAHRHGLPVIGSNKGNVPYLLVEAGVALEEDPQAWADELQRLYTDDSYQKLRQELAVENSQRYAFSGQASRLGQLIGFAQKRILVGVGAGIGNIVQTSPLIRRLAEHYGRPVDVVVNQDFPDCALLLAGHPHVNMVFTLDKNVVRREYDLVYISHSFGSFIPSFNANRVVVARNHFDFQATRDVHESLFNLRCAGELLGMDYKQGDAAKYFVGRYSRPMVGRRYIGIHSGGKGGDWDEGSWLSKRWPYYRDLAEALKARGLEVASFGVASEYVPGTIDLTGTPLAETIQNIAACEYFVGNDSGLMHIADALEVPLTTIFGPTSVVKNGPLATKSSVIELKKPCAPCQFDANQFTKCVCIAEVSLDQVLTDVLDKLNM